MTAKETTILITAFLLLAASTAPATEFFVSKNGDDGNEGKSEAAAFATVGKGASVLAPGDILTICPGEYFESVVCSLSGETNAPITIRAKIPRTAIIRGDAPLTAEFEKVPNLQFTYVRDEARDVHGVLDRGFLCHYKPAPSTQNIDRTPGSYFHDAENKKLYVHTIDSSSPAKHNLTLAGAEGEHGLYLKNTDKNPRSGVPEEKDWVEHVVIDGLTASGFARAVPKQTTRTGIGIGVLWPKHCVIRNCAAFLNATGVEFRGSPSSRVEATALKRGKSENCLIEDCAAYGNNDGGESGAAIICRGSMKDSAIRNCLAFKSSRCLRFYSGVIENCEIKDNIAFSSGDIWEKDNFDPGRNLISGNVCEKLIVHNEKSVLTRNLANSLVFPTAGPKPDPELINKTNIIMDRTGVVDFDANFAAPARLDYRLQSDSPFRGAGRAPRPYKDEVFFVKPDGDDDAAGTSVKQAWKTLYKACQNAKPGDAVYILGGVYDEKLVPANSGTERKPIVFSKRAHTGVAVKGIELKGKSHVTVNGLSVLKGEGPGVTVENGGNLTLEQCVVADRTGSAVLAKNARNLKISHSTLTGNSAGLELENCQDTIVSANIFNANSQAALKLDTVSLETLYSDYNSFGDAAKCAVASDGASDGNYDLKTWRGLAGLDEHSLTRVPEFDSEFHLRNSFLFNGYGPAAMPIGPYERIKKAVDSAIKLQAHSLTATTANIECQTPGALSNCELRWGASPECENHERMQILLTYTTSIFHYFSLIDLTPGQKYFYKTIVTIPTYDIFTNETIDPKLNDEKTFESKTSSFTTPTEEQPPITYHVSPSGDDKNDGLTWETPLRTINAAAAEIKAGDSIIVDDGEYNEDVIVRGTGEKGRPVTIKARNLGKVFLNGQGLIKSAFELFYKHWIIVDGFYIRNYARKTDDLSGCFSVVRGSNNSARRSIFDGRPSFPLQTVVGKLTSNLTVENCVFRNAWSDILCYSSPDAVIKNNVFYGNMCAGAVTMNNNIGAKFIISHNIICDQVPKKRLCALVSTGNLNSVTDEYNCYFTRLPEDEKKLYATKKPKREPMTFAEFQKRTGQGKTSFFANPDMPIIKEYETFKGDLSGRPHKFVTQELNFEVVRENGKKRRVPIIALYDQFIATNPKCLKADDGKAIGLNPKEFESVYQK